MTMIVENIDFSLILPELILACGAMILLVGGVFVGNRSLHSLCIASIALLITVLIVTIDTPWVTATTLSGFFVMDSFAGLAKILLIVGMMAALALAPKFLKQEHIFHFEYPVLALFALLGMFIMVSAHDLLTLYIGLELMSLSLYVLAAIQRNSLKAAEAGLKYFILGALSSGMILFGCSIIYGFAGSTNYDDISFALANVEEVRLGVALGFVFVLSGLAFKISAAPFHMWTPDVYEGAATSVTALFALVPKFAAIAVIMRLVLDPFVSFVDDWTQILWLLSAASMAVGAFAALGQENIKRLLAYSSIGHMGYALIGLVAATQDGAGTVIFYIVIYMIMTAGTFGVLLSLRRGGLAVDRIETLAGLSTVRPFAAYLLAFLMLSMAGIPPLAGFFGKLFIFQSAMESGLIILAVFGVLTSVVAAYYYLRIIKVMFFEEAVETLEYEQDVGRMAVTLSAGGIVLALVLAPESLLLLCREAVTSLF